MASEKCTGRRLLLFLRTRRVDRCQSILEELLDLAHQCLRIC